MKDDVLRELIVARMADFHSQRIQYLRALDLADVLKRQNSYLLRAISSQSAPELLKRIVLAYFRIRDEILLNTLVLWPVARAFRREGFRLDKTDYRKFHDPVFWHRLTGDPDFYLKIIRCLGDDEISLQRDNCESEWAMAMNRCLGEFIPQFCDEDGSINWERILKFTSGNDQSLFTRNQKAR